MLHIYQKDKTEHCMLFSIFELAMAAIIIMIYITNGKMYILRMIIIRASLQY